MKLPTRKARNEATAMRGARPKTKLKWASFSFQNDAAGSKTANWPSATTRKFMRKALQMMSLAFRKPHTSAMQSLSMYDNGKHKTPAVIVNEGVN